MVLESHKVLFFLAFFLILSHAISSSALFWLISGTQRRVIDTTLTRGIKPRPSGENKAVHRESKNVPTSQRRGLALRSVSAVRSVKLLD